ncbi:MAG: DUF2088 domain-containing protein [Planctomycetes bacterium]|nr:DUF2088 domain-containing protein [Planctomycetota bacterium]
MVLSAAEVERIVDDGVQALAVAGKRVLLLVPDGTRSCPLDSLFRLLHSRLAKDVAQLDVMFALGTHAPMDRPAMYRRLGITAEQHAQEFAGVQLFNHAWDDPTALMEVGVVMGSGPGEVSEERFAMDVRVTCNRRLRDYDLLLVVGPVFPHEVAGFSGGNKYLFPGVSGPEVLHVFHWLGALLTNREIIGAKWTPVRRVIDAAAAMVGVARAAFCMVVDGSGLAGLYHGTPEEAWSAAADHSARVHVRYTGRQFHTVLSCAPQMYPDLWTGGKCMYKLEPVVADGGTLILFAPHITEVSTVHGALLRQIGYHTRDYFVAQWPRFAHLPWGVLAHSTHVKGAGTYVDGVERPRVALELATGIPPRVCAEINLGYRDPTTVRTEDYTDREAEGVLCVRRAGEILYRPAPLAT